MVDPCCRGLTPADSWLDVAEATVSLGARELACRLNQGARSFAKATDNLARAAQVHMSAERLRQVVENAGRAVLNAHKPGRLTIPWTAADGHLRDAAGRPTAQTRVYLGADGVQVPLVRGAATTSETLKNP